MNETTDFSTEIYLSIPRYTKVHARTIKMQCLTQHLQNCSNGKFGLFESFTVI